MYKLADLPIEPVNISDITEIDRDSNAPIAEPLIVIPNILRATAIVILTTCDYQ